MPTIFLLFVPFFFTVVQVTLEYYVNCLLSKYLGLNKLNVHCLIMINFGRLSYKTENKYMYIIYIFNEPVRIYISSTISVDLNTGNLTSSGIVINN